MSDNFNRQQMAKLFRETADAIESGAIMEINIHMREPLGSTRYNDNGTQEPLRQQEPERIVNIMLRGRAFNDVSWASTRYVNSEPPKKLDSRAMRDLQHAATRSAMSISENTQPAGPLALSVLNLKHPNQANCEDCDDET